MFHYTASGLSNVYLTNGVTQEETSYGETVAIQDIEGLHRAIGMHIALDISVLDGEHVRFLRKELDFTQAQLAHLLGVTETTARNWESERSQVPEAAALVIRLLFVEFHNNASGVRSIVERIAELNREEFQDDMKLAVSEDNRWKSVA